MNYFTIDDNSPYNVDPDKFKLITIRHDLIVKTVHGYKHKITTFSKDNAKLWISEGFVYMKLILNEIL